MMLKSSTTTSESKNMGNEGKYPPIHPGEILLEDFMKPLGLSQNELSRALKVTPRRINEIVNGKRRVTGDTAMRLSRYFGNSAEFWIGLQADYDLDVAKDELEEKIKKEVQPRQHAA